MRLYKPERTLTIRFKDVPFDEVRGCHTPGDEEDRRCWEKCRNTLVIIFVPPVPEDFMNSGYIYFDNDGSFYSIGPAPLCPSGCHGPFYKLRDFEGTVCRHLVEIGD